MQIPLYGCRWDNPLLAAGAQGYEPEDRGFGAVASSPASSRLRPFGSLTNTLRTVSLHTTRSPSREITPLTLDYAVAFGVSISGLIGSR